MTSRIDQGARAWLLKTARENFWRVSSWYDLDDLVQDGFLCYQRTIAKYEERDYVTKTGVVTKKSRRVRSRKHIMSLFQRTYINHINDLSKLRTINVVEHLAFDLVVDPAVEDIWDVMSPEGSDLMDFEKLIGEAPKILRSLLQAIVADGSQFLLAAPYRVRRCGRETTNERLCRLIGADPAKFDLATMLKQYLRHEPIAA